METIGAQIRRQRRRLGLTLDDLAARSSISKPYLSLIETGRVPNPPSDEKLSRLEQVLGFRTGELLTQAHLHRTPRDVRAMLSQLLAAGNPAMTQPAGEQSTSHPSQIHPSKSHPSKSDPSTAGQVAVLEPPVHSTFVAVANGSAALGKGSTSITKGGTGLGKGPSVRGETTLRPGAVQQDHAPPATAQASRVRDAKSGTDAKSVGSKKNGKSKLPGVALDDLYLSGALQQFVDRAAGNVETVPTNVVPVINRVSAGYPKDFTDLSYPKGSADTYLSCPDVSDPDAFAARVHGDSMTPKYRQGDIVIFSPRAAVKNGDDAFVRFNDGQTTFKRVFFEEDESGRSVIRLQPRNEQYRPRITLAEEITGLWRAVFKYQSVDDTVPG